MLEGFSLAGQCPVHILNVEIPVKVSGRIPCFFVQQGCDGLIGNIFRQGIIEFLAFPEAFQEFINCALADTGYLGDTSAA